MAQVEHFEIHASDPEASMAFYGDLFGWRFEPMGDGYWLIQTGVGGGIDGGLLQREGPAPNSGAPVMGANLVVTVAQLDAAMNKARSLGAHPAVPKIPVPGMGWAGYVHDPDNNVLGLFQNDPEAK